MEKLTQLDERIAQVEASLATLRHEIKAMDRSRRGFLKVQDLIVIGERAVAQLKADRTRLAEGN